MRHFISNESMINNTVAFVGTGSDPKDIYKAMKARIDKILHEYNEYTEMHLGVYPEITRSDFVFYDNTRALYDKSRKYYINIEKKYKFAQYMIEKNPEIDNKDKHMIAFTYYDINKNEIKTMKKLEKYCVTISLIKLLAEFGIYAYVTAGEPL